MAIQLRISPLTYSTNLDLNSFSDEPSFGFDAETKTEPGSGFEIGFEVEVGRHFYRGTLGRLEVEAMQAYLTSVLKTHDALTVATPPPSSGAE